MAIFAAFMLLLAACSSTGNPPDALAFQDEDPSTVDEDPTTTTEAPTTTAAPTTTEAPTTTAAPDPGVSRPTNRTCTSSDYSVAFPSNVFLIAPTRTSQGSFPISVPAGTYDITVQTWLGFEDIPSHTMETWFFTTDSGYTSPVTVDSSPTLVNGQVFTAQSIPAGTTSITLFHGKPGSDMTLSLIHI